MPRKKLPPDAREIPLNNTKRKAICDEVNYDFLMQWDGQWFKTREGHVARPDHWRPGCLVYMHDEVMRRALWGE